MTKYFIQLYGDIDDLCNSRILEELDYYMYDVHNKTEMLYYFTKEQTVFVVTSDDTVWTFDKLYAVCRTSLRDNSFIIIRLDMYNGYISKTIWDNLNEESKKFFEDPTTIRATVKRGNKLSKLLSRIKRAVKKSE